jgi:hypothetical protein
LVYFPEYIVTCTPIAKQRVGEHIPATQALNNRTSKHAFRTIEDVIFREILANWL